MYNVTRIVEEEEDKTQTKKKEENFYKTKKIEKWIRRLFSED